jgi:hypothetical protein
MLGVHHIIANIEAERLRSHFCPFRLRQHEPTRLPRIVPQNDPVVAARVPFTGPAKRVAADRGNLCDNFISQLISKNHPEGSGRPFIPRYMAV